MLKQLAELSKKAKVTLVIETNKENEMSVIVLFDLKDKDDKSLNITPIFCSSNTETIEEEVLQGIDLFTKQSLGILERIKFVSDSAKKAENEALKTKTTKKKITPKKEGKSLFDSSSKEIVAPKRDSTGKVKEEKIVVKEQSKPEIKEPNPLLEERIAELEALGFKFNNDASNVSKDDITIPCSRIVSMPPDVFSNLLVKYEEKFNTITEEQEMMENSFKSESVNDGYMKTPLSGMVIPPPPPLSLDDIEDAVVIPTKPTLEMRFKAIVDTCKENSIPLGTLQFSEQTEETITKYEAILAKRLKKDLI